MAPGTELVRGDLLQPASLGAAFSGVDTAFYLVHSMKAVRSSKRRSTRPPRTSRAAAREAGVRRIIYLGGLAHGAELSPHMRSRAETGNILRSSGIPVIEFQASIVIGSGSASFEMIRALVERLPVMITPRWVNTAAQPIAIEDVIEYLAARSGCRRRATSPSKSAGAMSLPTSGSCASTPASGNCGAGSCACRSSACRCRAAG